VLNPMQMMQAFGQLKAAQNPLQMMQQMFSGDPTFNRAMQMAQGKSPQQVEQIVRNLCQERGIDFEQFKQNFGQFGMK
jgi:hypothetical protein